MLTRKICGAVICLFAGMTAMAQTTTHYDLVKLLNQNGFVSDTGNHALALASKDTISTQRILWLKGVRLKNGTIDIDLRGKDVFLRSFLGIAFHAADTGNYDAIYFRPFRFHSADTPTRRWSVQYVGLPKYGWDTLRKTHPWVYENSVNPVPGAADWFHATIVLKDDWITVYVNHSSTPSLKIRSLNTARDGSIGLWDDELPGDFANLEISR